MAGRSLVQLGCTGGKSGLHEDRTAGNARPARVEGKCHRKQTAPDLIRGKGERVR